MDPIPHPLSDLLPRRKIGERTTAGDYDTLHATYLVTAQEANRLRVALEVARRTMTDAQKAEAARLAWYYGGEVVVQSIARTLGHPDPIHVPCAGPHPAAHKLAV